MQLTIYLNAPGPVRLPVHYASQVQGMIYHSIDNPRLRSYLHQQGFPFEKRRFKLFTFSRLMAEQTRFNKESKMLVMTPPIKLVISSPVSFLLQELGTGLLKQKEIRIGKVTLRVEEIATAAPQVNRSEIRVRMLSPLTVYSTMKTPDGRKFTYYYSPYEERFNELVIANLEKKRLVVYGALETENRFMIAPGEVKESDFKITRYRDFVIKGWLGEYELQGEPELLQLALDAGLGSKNSQGYGCCVLCE